MIFEFKFPDIGEGVHEGKVLQLNFKNGDKIEEGNILATVETDKEELKPELSYQKTSSANGKVAPGDIIEYTIAVNCIF